MALLSSMLDDSSLWCGADGLVAASGGAAGAVAAEQCDTRRDLIAGGVAQPGVCRCEQRLRLGVRSAHATARRCAAGSMPIRLNMASMRDRTLPTASLTGWLGGVQVIAEEIGLGGSPSPTVRAYFYAQ